MRNYGTSISLYDLVAQSANQTRVSIDSYNQGAMDSNPELAQRIVNLATAYPNMPNELLVYAGLSGLEAEDELSLQLANRVQEKIVQKNTQDIVTNVSWGKRKFQQGMLLLDAAFQPASRGFKSAVVAAQETGRSVPLTVAQAAVGGLGSLITGRASYKDTYTANYLDSVVGPGVGAAFQNAKEKYGPTEYQMYLDERKKGNPINLGTGFIPRSIDLKETQVYLDEIRRGTPTNEAMSKARDVYGLPITQLFDLREDRYKYTTKSGEKINISPGRVVAAQVQEPGSMGYNVLSGIIDGVFRLAADPTNLALAYGAGVKTAMRGMVQSSQQVKLAKDGISLTTKTLANTFKLGKKGKKARLAFYGRTIDDIRQTGWGQKFGQALADLKGDEGMTFLNDIPEFKNIHPSFKEVILQVDNADDVWNVLEMVAKGGNLTQKNFDDVFTMLKTKLPTKAAELDRVRNLTLDNINFGLDVLPAKPTVTGEMFNYMGKLMTGQATDVAPLRKLTGALLSRDNPAKKLLGMGTQLSKAVIPRHVRRAMQLRPETVMVIGDLGAAANNADDMLKLSFADANTRGKFVREVLSAENQNELNEITHRINKAIAKSVTKENPKLKIDVDDIIKQQEAFVAELDELRSFFDNTYGKSLAFNGAKIKKKFDQLITDAQAHFEATGVQVAEEDLKRVVFEAVPSMHLLTQASDSFTASLLDPRDVVRATRAHQSLIGPEDSLLRAWVNKPKDLLNESDYGWTDFLKIPRKALVQNAKANKLSLKPKGPIDTILDDLQNNILKPAWMFRYALKLRIAPEEALRAAFGGTVNIFTTPLKRAALLSNKSLGYLGQQVRENEVLSAYNNLGEIVFSSRMSPDDVIMLKNLIDEKSLDDFKAIDYPKIQNLIKHNLLEVNYAGEPSDYIIEAALNGYNVKNLVVDALPESAFKTTSKKIKATSKGNIVGYDGNTYDSMGEAFLKAGGFSADLDERQFFDLQVRKPSDADVFVSAYKNKEYNLGNLDDIESKAELAGLSSADYINTQLDNIFFDDESVALLSKKDHVLGTYIDSEGNYMIDVAIGLRGQNAIDNAVYLGAQSFQESVFVANKELASQAGFGKAIDDFGMLPIYEAPSGGAANINIDAVLNKTTMEAMYKSNFDALSLKVEDVKGAAQGMPSGSLFSTDEAYLVSQSETAITRGLLDGRKDLAENLYVMTDKRQADGVINPRYWEGLWGEIGEILSQDYNTVLVANFGVDGALDILQRPGTARDRLEEFVKRSYNPEDKLYLTDKGALKEYLESIAYRIGKATGNPTAKILDPVTGREMSAELATKVFYNKGKKTYPKFTVDLSVGSNTKLFQFIKNGGVIDGKDWARYKQHINTMKFKERGQGNQKFYKEFIKVFKDEVDAADLGPNQIPRKFDLQNRVSESGTIISGEEIKAAGFIDDIDFDNKYSTYQKLMERGYNNLISKPSNKLNRDPLFRYAFYEAAIEILPYMTQEAKDEFMKGAKVWVDGNSLWDDLTTAAKQPSLENTITSVAQAETLLKHSALQQVQTLFYSLSKRHVASDLFSKYIPFPEIWAEVAQSWGKLIVDNPQKFNRARIAVDNGQESKPWDSENGFFSKDPNTGKQVFNYVDVFNVLSLGSIPALGKAIEMSGNRDAIPDKLAAPFQSTVFGQDLTDQGIRATAPGFATGLNLVAQNGFAPGFGPIVTIPMKFIMNKLGSPKLLRKTVLGEFENAGAGSILEQGPAYLKKFFSALDSGDETTKRGYATTMGDIYTAYVLAGLVDQSDPASVTKYLDQAGKQARNIYIFRGLAQFSLPTAVVPRIEVEDKNGTWYGVQTLVSKYQEILIKNGYDHFQTQQDFIEKFGINPIPLKQAKSYKTGRKPLKENSFFYWIKPENKRLLEADALPNTGYYIFPDKIEDELFYPAYFELTSVDLTPNQRANYMRHSQAIFEYEKGKQDIREENLSPGEQQRRFSDLKNSIDDEYGIDIFNYAGKPRTASTIELMQELRRWTDFEQTNNSPEWKYIEAYLDRRDEIIDVLLNGGTYTYKDLTLNIVKPTKRSRTLNGVSEGPVRAREIMTQIWTDLIEESQGTNFAQLANEVLFYEISPNNSANSRD